MIRKLLLALALLVCLPMGAEAASRFWFNGTGNWSDTAHWGTASNGVGAPASVPGASDTATFDANSGAGTTTIDQDVSVTTLTISALNGGTITNPTGASAKNLTIGNFVDQGTNAHTLNMGDGTWSLTGTAGNVLLFQGTQTVNANGSTIAFTGTPTGNITFNTNGKTFNIVTFPNVTNGFGHIITGNATFTTLTKTGGGSLLFGSSPSLTVGTLNIAPSAITAPLLFGGSAGGNMSMALTNPVTAQFVALAKTTFTGAAATFTNSFDLGGNVFSGGGGITPPSTGGGGGFIIGGG